MQTLIELVFDALKSVVDLDEWGRHHSRSVLGESRRDREARWWLYGSIAFVIVIVLIGAALFFLL